MPSLIWWRRDLSGLPPRSRDRVCINFTGWPEMLGVLIDIKPVCTQANVHRSSLSINQPWPIHYLPFLLDLVAWAMLTIAIINLINQLFTILNCGMSSAYSAMWAESMQPEQWGAYVFPTNWHFGSLKQSTRYASSTVGNHHEQMITDCDNRWLVDISCTYSTVSTLHLPVCNCVICPSGQAQRYQPSLRSWNFPSIRWSSFFGSWECPSRRVTWSSWRSLDTGISWMSLMQD